MKEIKEMKPDDFIAQHGADAFKKLLTGNPAWRFMAVQAVNVAEIRVDTVELYLRQLVLESEVVVSVFLGDVKKATKVGLPELKNVMSKARGRFRRLLDQGVTIATIDWHRDAEPPVQFFNKVGKFCEGEGSFYTERESNTLMVRDFHKNRVERICDGDDLARRLTHKVSYRRFTVGKDGPRAAHGYEPMCPDLMETFLRQYATYCRLPIIRFASDAPTYLNGKLYCDRSAVDAASEILYLGPRIEPSRSIDQIRRLFESFPFQDHASYVNTIGGALSAVLFREEYVGARPALLLRGDKPNTCKTTLAQCIALLGLGSEVSATSLSRDEAETQKAIVTKLKEQQQFILFDNIRMPHVSSAFLEQALTSRVIAARILSTNTEVRARNNLQFMLTLNHGSLSPDLSTRSIPIFLTERRLDKVDPDFQPKTYVESRRITLLSELCGMVVRWIDAGSPTIRVPYPKYPAFAATINGILEVSGISGFLSNYREAEAKLDPIMQALLDGAVAEMLDSGVRETESRSAHEWRMKIQTANNFHLFDEYRTDKSQDTKVGATLRLMAMQPHVTDDHDGQEIRVRVVGQVDPAHRRGSCLYRFVIEQGGTTSIVISETHRSSNEAVAGSGAETSVSAVPVTQTLTPANRAVRPETEISTPARGCKYPVARLLAVAQIIAAADPAADAPVISVIPDEGWNAITSSRAFHYRFLERTIKAAPWDGSNLGELIAFDVETRKIEGHELPDFALGSACNGKQVAFLTREMLPRFVEVHRASTLIAHNSAFDLAVLGRETTDEVAFAFIDRQQVLDTMLLARLLNLATTGECERRKGRYRLVDICERHLGVNLPKDVEVGGQIVKTTYGDYMGKIEQAPDAYFHYNAFDTISTFFLAGRQLADAVRHAQDLGVDPELLLSLDVQVKTSFVAGKLERDGVGLDPIAVAENRAILTAAIDDAAHVLKAEEDALLAPEERKRKVKAKLHLTFDRIENQFGVRLPRRFDKRTKGLTFSEQGKDLERFRNIPYIDALLTHKQMSTYLKKYVDPFEGKERCHPHVNPLMVTGRISVHDPALQQIPRPKGAVNLRRQFVPQVSQMFAIHDFSGAELVTFAQTLLDIFGRSRLADALNRGDDVHKYLASIVTKRPIEEIGDDDPARQQAKAINFGIPGGLGTKRLIDQARDVYRVTMTESEAERFKEIYFSAFPEVKDYLELTDQKLAASYQEAFSCYPGPYWRMAASPAFFRIIAGETTTYQKKRPYDSMEVDWAWNVLQQVRQRFPVRFLKLQDSVNRRIGSSDLALAARGILTSIIPATGRVRALCEVNEYRNNAFQGLMADIANEGWYRLVRAGHRVALVVHDEVVCEAVSEEMSMNQQNILLEPARVFCPDVQMKIKSKLSTCWTK